MSLRSELIVAIQYGCKQLLSGKTKCTSWTFQDTFSRAKTWVKELQRQASPNIVIALAGNKADLANKRVVEYEVKLIFDNRKMMQLCIDFIIKYMFITLVPLVQKMVTYPSEQV